MTLALSVARWTWPQIFCIQIMINWPSTDIAKLWMIELTKRESNATISRIYHEDVELNSKFQGVLAAAESGVCPYWILHNNNECAAVLPTNYIIRR